MKAVQQERKIVLVVEDKEIFTEFLHSFACDHFEVCFAEGPSDALSLGSLRSLRLVTIPLDSKGTKLAGALKEVSRDAITILGIDQGPAEGLDSTPDCFDTVVARSNLRAVAKKARSLLEERRKHPRVMVEFPVKLGPKGTGNVKDISATSLQVLTMMPLEVGENVQIEIGESVAPYQFEATVGRVRRSVHGQNALVLHIQEEDDQTCEYLEQLVQKVMEVQYYLDGDRPRPGGLRGPMSWDLARRVERNLRESQELKVVNEELTREPPSDRIESRYRLGHHLGCWGVGEVFLASHLLLKRPVVIKVISKDLRDDKQARQRMEREATIPSKLTCPGIVDVIDFGEDGHGGLFYTMEALTGEPLAALVEGGETFSDRDVARLGVHIAAALVIAHLRGYGHFDLCPENVFMQKWSGGPAWPLLINVGGAPTEGTLEDTHPLGKELWPPEAPRATVGPKHDIFSLGALLEHLRKHASSSGEGKGSKLLREVLWQARTPGPDDRFPDMTVMAQALVRCLEDPDLATSAEHKQQIETPGDLKKMFGPGEASARTYSTRLMAEALSTFASIDPRTDAAPPAKERAKKPAKKEEKDILVVRSPPSKEKKEPKPVRVPGTATLANRPVAPRTNRRIPYPLILGIVALLLLGVFLWQRKSSTRPSGGVKVPDVAASKASPARPKAAPKSPAVKAVPKKEAAAKLPPLEPDEIPDVKAGLESDVNPMEDAKTTPVTEPSASPAPPPAPADTKVARKAAIKKTRQLLKKKKFTEARQQLTLAQNIRDNARLQVLFGMTHEKEGNPAKAIVHLQKAANMQSDVAWYRIKLGRLYLQAGKTTEACQAFRRASRMEPTYKPARRLVQKHCRN